MPTAGMGRARDDWGRRHRGRAVGDGDKRAAPRTAALPALCGDDVAASDGSTRVAKVSALSLRTAIGSAGEAANGRAGGGAKPGERNGSEAEEALSSSAPPAVGAIRRAEPVVPPSATSCVSSAAAVTRGRNSCSCGRTLDAVAVGGALLRGELLREWASTPPPRPLACCCRCATNERMPAPALGTRPRPAATRVTCRSSLLRFAAEARGTGSRSSGAPRASS